MEKYEFRRDEFEWAEEFYDIIQKRMDLPEWFGKNADALWDMLTGYIGLPCEITFVGFGEEKNKYNNLIIGRIKKVFNSAEQLYPDKFRIIYKNQEDK